MKLHIPTKRPGKKRWYCGPFAIAAITGCSFNQAREWANKAKLRDNPNQGVCAMTDNQVRDALCMAGFTSIIAYWPRGDRPTFRDFLKLPRAEGSILLVSLTDHFVTIQDSQFIDNHTEHKVHVNYAPWQRKRVRIAWEVTDHNPFNQLAAVANREV